MDEDTIDRPPGVLHQLAGRREPAVTVQRRLREALRNHAPAGPLAAAGADFAARSPAATVSAGLGRWLADALLSVTAAAVQPLTVDDAQPIGVASAPKPAPPGGVEELLLLALRPAVAGAQLPPQLSAVFRQNIVSSGETALRLGLLAAAAQAGYAAGRQTGYAPLQNRLRQALEVFMPGPPVARPPVEVAMSDGQRHWRVLMQALDERAAGAGQRQSLLFGCWLINAWLVAVSGRPAAAVTAGAESFRRRLAAKADVPAVLDALLTLAAQPKLEAPQADELGRLAQRVIVALGSDR